MNARGPLFQGIPEQTKAVMHKAKHGTMTEQGTLVSFPC